MIFQSVNSNPWYLHQKLSHLIRLSKCQSKVHVLIEKLLVTAGKISTGVICYQCNTQLIRLLFCVIFVILNFIGIG